MEGASYRVTVTLERGSDRPKCQRESKVHPTFECLISMVDKSQSDLVCRCSANGFFSDYRKLHIKMKDLSLKFTTSQPFPPSFTKSFYGIGLSKAQLEQRTFILANWIKEVILLFPKAPESIQKAVMEFFFVHSMNKVEYTNRVFTWLRNMGSTSKNHLSNSHLSLGRSASPLPVSDKPPSPPPMIEKPVISIPPSELKYSHEVKSCSSSSYLSHHPIIDKEKYFPKLGIRISQLLVFIEQCGGRNVFHNLSTKEVCDLYIKPVTADKELSFCEWLIACNPTSPPNDRSSPVSLPSVSTANVFVSHCWKNKFLDFVDILIEHFPTSSSSLPRTRSLSSSPVLSSSPSSPSNLSHRGKEIYLWIDIFSLNQHQSILRYQQESWWQQVLQPAITSFSHMVTILPSWKECNSVFDRTWCLYELFLFNNNNNNDESNLSFLLPSQEKQSFIQELTTKLDSILPLFDKINIENSQTSLSIDYDTIIHQLRSSISSSSFTTIVNETVQRKIRKWIVDLLNQEILNEKENIKRRFDLMKVLGGIYFYYHEINAAENIYQLCINKSIQIYGIEHIYTLHLYHHRSIDYAIKGNNINKGIELMNECYDMKKKYLGEYHLSTMFTYYYIGILYYLDRNRIKGLKIIHLSIQFFKHYLLSLSSSNSSSTSSSASTLLLLSSTSSSGGVSDDTTTSSFDVLQLIFIPLIEYFKSFKDYDEIEQVGILLFELELEEYVRYGIHTLQEIYQVQGIPLEKLLEKFKNSSYYNDRQLLVKEILLTPII